jgi:hypothetical protein
MIYKSLRGGAIVWIVKLLHNARTFIRKPSSSDWFTSWTTDLDEPSCKGRASIALMLACCWMSMPVSGRDMNHLCKRRARCLVLFTGTL